MTKRDFFWDDPFFSDVWEDFDRLRKDIWQENRDFFSRFEQQHQALEKESFSSSSMSSKKNASRALSTSDHRRNWLLPRFEDDFFDDADFKHWPKLLTTSDEILKVSDDDTKFQVSVNTHGYKPEELQVKVKDNVVTIEAKHEEKSEDKSKKSFVSRQFSRSYTLPQGCKMETVKSNLSADGILMVTAPKAAKSIKFEESRKVPIQMKKY